MLVLFYRQFLLSLIKNGPDQHPGAKILEKKNGNNISLRYVDRESINLDNVSFDVSK